MVTDVAHVQTDKKMSKFAHTAPVHGCLWENIMVHSEVLITNILDTKKKDCLGNWLQCPTESIVPFLRNQNHSLDRLTLVKRVKACLYPILWSQKIRLSVCLSVCLCVHRQLAGTKKNRTCGSVTCWNRLCVCRKVKNIVHVTMSMSVFAGFSGSQKNYIESIFCCIYINKFKHN